MGENEAKAYAHLMTWPGKREWVATNTGGNCWNVYRVRSDGKCVVMAEDGCALWPSLEAYEAGRDSEACIWFEWGADPAKR